LTVLKIFSAEELNQKGFFAYKEKTLCQPGLSSNRVKTARSTRKLTLDPSGKELPQHEGIPNETHHIPQHQLRTQSPPKETKVARVSQISIQPSLNQNMALLMLGLNVMVEITRSLRHGHRPDNLADNCQDESQDKQHRHRCPRERLRE
jgi:hypothetical protein